MQTNTFNQYWQENHPKILPFVSELRLNYPDKWFRIHSLPKSKRYADAEEEYQIIFDRQNKLITEVIGDGTELIVVFSLATNDITNTNYYDNFDFTEFEKASTLDLHKIREEDYDPGTSLDIYFKTIKWKGKAFDKILKAIADDEIRVLLICPSIKRIIAPYDGGIDVIMKNETQRNVFKIKYKDWLSDRKDGL